MTNCTGLPRRLLAYASVALATLIGFPAAAAGPQLLRPSTLAAPKAGAPKVAVPGIPVEFNAREMLALRHGDEVQLTLPNGVTHDYIFELAQRHGGDVASWVGRHKELGKEHRVIITNGPGGSYGILSTPGREYRLVPGGARDYLVDMTEEQARLPAIDLGTDFLFPPPRPKGLRDEEPVNLPETTIAIPGVNTVGIGKVTPSPQHIVDLMIVYTNGLAANLGPNLATRLNFLVTRANTAYADSEVAITLRLVNTTMVTYSDATSDLAALNAISPLSGSFNAGTFGSIESIRNSAGADLVALLRNGSNFGGSGIAWVGSSAPSAPYMYSVTTGCVAGCESVFIHEVGHNMGNMHDRHTASWQEGGTPTPPQGAFPYSYGYAFCLSGSLTCNPTVPGGCASQPECSPNSVSNFSDIMAYFHASTERIYKFSNPAINCSTTGDATPRPCGVSEVSASSANTALSMNNNRVALSSLKATMFGSSLQFTAGTIAAAESAGSMVFTVSRTGSTSGAISVNYATGSGSALAGSDFTATSGTLNWANGDGANKTITVPIANDGVTEDSETFTVTLSSPSPAGGPTGAVLGSLSVATGLIVSPWPAGGVLPAGYITPGASSGAWAVASDQAYEGASSLRSANVMAATQGVAVNSDASFVGEFVAGTVSFAYRVSSYQGLGDLEFSIDGATLLIESGESGWKLASFPITSGTHTLRWRFANRLNFPCAFANPPAAGGGSCADRVWIDAVSLPMTPVSMMAFALPGYAVTESAPSVTLDVNRAGPADNPVSVNYATANGTAIAGTHYAATSGTLNWAGGDSAPKQVVVPITDDGVVNAARTFTVSLSNPVGGTAGGPSTVTIADDDNTLQFAFATTAVTEGTPSLIVTVTRAGATGAAASVDWITVDSTATAGTDFGAAGVSTPVFGNLSWAAGDAASKTITIPILDDAIAEPAKTFFVGLGNPAGAGASVGAQSGIAVTLFDDEASLEFSSPANSVGEMGGNTNVTVNRSGAATNAVSVTWTTANGSAIAGQDFGTAGNPAQRSGTLSWPAGDSSPKSFAVGSFLATLPIINDALAEGDESFTITLSAPTGGAVLGPTSTATLTIVDDESTVGFSPATLTVSEAGPNATLTLTRTGSSATAASVSWTTASGTAGAGSDFTQSSGTVNWAAGDGAPKTIAVGPTAAAAPYIAVLNDTTIEGPETFTVTLFSPTGGAILGTATATVTIDSDDSGITMTSPTQAVTESAGSVAVSVTRSGPSAGAVSVNYATANGTALAGTHYTATSGTLNWADGDTAAKTITVPVIDDGAVNAARTFAVGLAGAVGATLGSPSSTTVTIADDDNTVQFTSATATVTEGTPSLVLTVSRVGGTAGAASVNWASADGTAVAGSDFGVLGNASPVSGTLSWAAGDAASKTITIPILDDAAVESVENFFVGLGNPIGASIGTPASTVVTVLDNEASLNFSSPTYAVGENGSNTNVTVNRSGAATNAVSVTWTTANGSAIAGQDFGTAGNPAQRSGTLSWPAGDSSPKSFAVGSFLATLPIINDALAEGDESFTITLSAPTGGAVLGPTSTATLTIVDDESTVGFSPATLTVSEAGPNATLTLTRTGSSATAASVSWTTASGTAGAGSDFTQSSGTVNWAAGDGAPKTIAVGPTAAAAPYIAVLNDTTIEGPETFTVTLFSPTGGAILGTATATVTIDSDDSGITMTSPTQAVTESAGSVAVSVTRSGPSAGAVSVNYATANGTALAGTHYTATSGTLNWADGDTAAKTITVPVIDDGAVNAARTFAVGLAGAVGATLGSPSSTTVTIADDDNTVQFTSATATVTEGTPSLVLTVSRVGGTAGAASVNWASADGTAVAGSDFGVLGNASPVSGTLSWAAGDAASKTITIPILDDAAVESVENFFVGLGNPIGASIGTPASTVVTVLDNEASLNFSSPTYAVGENGSNTNVTVNRSGAATNAVSVTWTTANGSAIAGQDFGTAGNPAQRSGTLSWPAGDSSPKSFAVGSFLATLPIINDALAEGDESFTITLSAPTGGAVLGPTSTATLTIVDDESTVGFSPATLTVSEAGPNATLTLTRTGSSATAASVSWTTASGTAGAGSDFTQSSGTVNWAAGDGAPKTIAVGPTAAAAPYIAVLNDTTIEGPETFTVTLFSPTGGAILGTATATVTIDSDDSGITMTSPTQAVTESAGSVAVSVTRSGPSAGAVSVNYATANGTALAGTHYTATSGTLNWADGDTAAKTITVPVIDDGAVNAARTFAVGLAGAVGATLGSPSSTTVTIADDDNTVQFTSATATVTEGTPSLVLTVSRVGGTAGAASVNWASADGTAVAGSDFGVLGNASPVSGTLSWAAGDAASKTITIPILDDALVESAENFTVALSGPVGASVGTVSTATVTLNDNDIGVVFDAASYVVAEAGGAVTITANRIGPATSAASVGWTTANGSAVAGQDFGTAGNPAQRSGTLSWAAGDSAPKSLSIPIVNDAVAEGNETFTVEFFGPSPGLVLGTPSTTWVNIVDDETPPESTLQFSVNKTTVTETMGTVTLTVTRTGSGFTFPASVNYSTTPVSALAASDYTTTAGTLTWPAGDSTPRTITVPITGDAIAEPPEQFAVLLASPSPGVALGTNSIAVVLVLDDDEIFPPLGGIPPGWTMPPAANAGWNVSNDPGALEGVLTLRTDTAFDNEVAQVEVSGTYLAGTLSFFVKVSSEPGFDALRFYVDGVRVGEWSGTTNTGWQAFSIPVSAGAHAFRWSYEKDGSGAFGQDAAWLDSVTLPPQ